MSPKTTNPKNIQINILVDSELANTIETLASELGVTKSELIRQAISEFVARQVKVLLRKLELEVKDLEEARKRIEELVNEDPEQEILAHRIPELCRVWCRDCSHLEEFHHCVVDHDENLCREWGCIRSAEQWLAWINARLSELGKKLSELYYHYLLRNVFSE